MAAQYSIRVHIEEALEIARDVARGLLESYQEHGDPSPEGLRQLTSSVDLDIAVTV